MIRRTTSSRGFVLLACAALALLPACGGASVDEAAADDLTAGDSALSSSLPIGTALVTTTSVNFRQGPGTDTAVLRTLAKGTAVVTVNRTTPSAKFINVSAGGQAGWVHGAYLAQGVGAPTDPAVPAPGGAADGCIQRKLKFSADALPSPPAAGSAFVWGGNATGGEQFLEPPYSGAFLAAASVAHSRQLEVFAYLEGPCGNTGGVDDGERARCRNIHTAYNQRFSPNTPDTAAARWKPFTMKQLTTSGQLGVDYCEIDNLENQVTIPLNPLLAEIKGLYDTGKIHCRIVLKNVDASALDAIRASVATTPVAASFIAPFAIYEADNTAEKASLDRAMKRLKGPGAVTIVSLDTNHYGSAFTPDSFLACK